MISYFAFWHTNSLLKEVYSKRKEFAPFFKVDTFQKVVKSFLTELPPLKVFQFPLEIKDRKYSNFMSKKWFLGHIHVYSVKGQHLNTMTGL